MTKRGDTWQHIGDALCKWWMQEIPEATAYREQLRDTIILEDVLRPCHPALAKRVINRARRYGSISGEMAEVLMKRFNLVEA